MLSNDIMHTTTQHNPILEIPRRSSRSSIDAQSPIRPQRRQHKVIHRQPGHGEAQAGAYFDFRRDGGAYLVAVAVAGCSHWIRMVVTPRPHRRVAAQGGGARPVAGGERILARSEEAMAPTTCSRNRCPLGPQDGSWCAGPLAPQASPPSPSALHNPNSKL